MAGSSWDESRCANPAGGDRRKFEYGPEQMLPLSTGRGVARALARRLGREAGLAPPRRSALHIAQRLGRAGAPKQRPCDLLASTQNHQYTNAAAFSLVTRGGQHACVSR